MSGGLLIAAGVAILTYVWLGYSMNVVHNPLLAMVIYYPVLCLGGGALLRKMRAPGRIDYDAGVQRSPIVPTLVYSVAATLVLWASSLLIRPGLADPEIVTHGLEVCGMYKADYWLTAWVVVLVNPVFEEFLWRLGFFSYLYSRFSRATAIHVSSLVFAGYHPVVVAPFFPPGWLIVVFVVVYLGGVAFASLFLQTRNVIYPMVFHMVVNLNLMLMGYQYAP